jgi:outer membrane lipoprotein
MLVLAGCAGPPSSLEQAPASSPQPVAVADNAAAFEGRQVVWGGRIVSVSNESDATLVTVLSKPLDGQLRPDDEADGDARFIARFDGFRDPLVFREERLLTVVGRIDGKRAARVGDFRYDQPVVVVTGHELWEPRPTRVYPHRRYDPFHDRFHDPFIFSDPCFRHPRYCW